MTNLRTTEEPVSLRALLLPWVGPMTDEEITGARQRARETRRREEAERCPACRGQGFVMTAKGVGPCACTLREWRARYLAALPQGNLARLNVDEGNRQAVVGARAYGKRKSEGRAWLVLAGPPGTGKTYVATGVLRARALADPPQIGVLRSCVDLLSWLKEGMDEDAQPDLEARIALASGWPLLVLDDLGAHQRTEWAWTVLEQILDARYRARLETIVTLETMLGLPDRMASRLMDRRNSWVFTLTGPDRRQG